jgi:hypothetical protein
MVSDNAYNSQYLSAAQLLLEASSGNPSGIPSHYLNNLDHTFVNGDISLVPAISRFIKYQELAPEEVIEVIEELRKVSPDEYPSLKDIESVDVGRYFEEEHNDDNFSFVEDNLGTAEKTERVLSSCIESVFGSPVKDIRDLKGKFPSEENDFLLKEDGTFSGTFTAEGFKFRFEIAPTKEGWLCTYRLGEESLESLPERVEDLKKGNKHKQTTKSVRTRGWS